MDGSINRKGIGNGPKIWGAALLVYFFFLGWYVNWQGPMNAREIDAVMARYIANTPADQRGAAGVLRSFLEKDDGREFHMVNLVRIAPGKVVDPVTGKKVPARMVLDGYTSMFMSALFARAGHPVIVARKVGPYLDAWGVEADPGWTIFGYIRYRSRRDMALLASDPRFAAAHDFKFAAISHTYAFPVRQAAVTLVPPTLWVGLVLALAAALTHLLIVLRATRRSINISAKAPN